MPTNYYFLRLLNNKNISQKEKLLYYYNNFIIFDLSTYSKILARDKRVHS